MNRYYKKKQSESDFQTAKRFIQWAYYNGGLGMIFIILGVILILFFGITASLLNWCKFLVLIVGITSIGFGFYLKNKDDKK